MSSADFDNLKYMTGFGNEFKSEDPRCPKALPKNQNSPQNCPYGLYAEQLSGTAFTAPRESNRRTWMYRIQPACKHQPFKPMDNGNITNKCDEMETTPNQLKWNAFEIPARRHDFLQGMSTICGSGHPNENHGVCYYVYTCNTPMQDKCMCNADGDMLIVPQQGKLKITTECGKMMVEPNEICVVPRGMRLNVHVDGPSRGYIMEVYNGHFRLPELGAIGANGLANPRDFEVPVACYEDRSVPNYTVVQKHMGRLHCATQDHSPFDVVAYHGNYVPYKYNLNNFMAINSVSYDHCDPCIFTVLTCPSDRRGTAIADFVCFPPRYAVQDHTFRPPYYHRNCMSEFMGYISGNYEAKRGTEPGSATLHQAMTPHGPDSACYKQATSAKLTPERVAEGCMSFMFESCLEMAVAKWAMTQKMDQDYNNCWADLPKKFNPNQKPQ